MGIRYFLTVSYFLLLVGCANTTAPVNLENSAAVLNQAPQRCDTTASIFAKKICGDYDRRGSRIEEERQGITLTTELLEKYRDTMDVGDGVRFSSKKTAYYNVLREHLAGELKNIRQCAIAMSTLAKADCKQENCTLRCRQAKHAQLQEEARAGIDQCLATKQSMCRANCRMKQGTYCESLCHPEKNTRWLGGCLSRGNRVSKERLERSERHLSRCQSAC